MQNELGTKNVQVRLTTAEHKALQDKVGARRIQAHLRLLINLDLQGKAGFPYKAEHKEWHDKLDRVLSEGTQRDQIGIQQNLDWAVNNLPSRPQRRAKAG